MNDNVTPLEPHSMALFFSIDGPPRVEFRLCNRRTLSETVQAHMFSDPDETAGYVARLLETGHCEFEDGFLHLCTGMHAVATYLMVRLRGAFDDMRSEDAQRAREFIARRDAEAKYAALQGALIEALADKAPAIVTLAAAGQGLAPADKNAP